MVCLNNDGETVILKIITDRKTGKIIKEEITETLDMTVEEYYRPLVEIFYRRLMGRLNEKEEQ
jgi:hypothetical protein